MFPGFFRIDQRRQIKKDYFIVSRLTLLHKNETFILLKPMLSIAQLLPTVFRTILIYPAIIYL